MAETAGPGTGLLTRGWWIGGLRDGEDAAAPAWAARVERAVETAADLPSEAGSDGGSDPGAAAFAPALEPFVVAATDELTASWAPAPDGVPLAVAVAALRTALRDRLTRTAARTLVVELAAARDRGELTAAEPRDRFAQFVARTRSAAGLGALVTTYPVLGRLLGQTCGQEVAAVRELARRFAADRAAVVDRLLGGVEPGAVASVTVGSGDRHAGGRSVAVLEFTGGARAAYKPRPVTLHHRFAELVAVLDAASPGLAPRAAHAVAGEGYGWVEFVPRRPCATTAQVERFHRRTGALLALLHAIDATDAHCENVIACADHPVLVDVETLLHPTRAGSDPVAADPALRAITASVQRTALLPRPILGEHGALDLSGLGGGAGVAADPGVRWVDAGTDRMRLVRGRVRYTGGDNAPTHRGEPVDPRQHRAELLAGFHAAHDAVRAAAATLLAEDGPLSRCATEPVRYVARDTAVYARLLDESTHPDLLRTAADRQRVLDVLHEDPPVPGLVPHELLDLWDGDVPLFTVLPGECDVRTSRGARLAGAMTESALDRVRRTLAGTGPADVERQEWMIRATLALADGPLRHRATAGVRRSGAAPAGPDRSLAAACAVGDQLVALAERDEQRANWVGVEQVDDRFWAVLPLGAGLGTGYPGVALFLAQLGSVTGLPRYTDLARRAITPLPWLVSTLADPARAEAVGCGAFAGLGGITYALARLATLLGDPGPAALLPAAIAATATAGRATARSDDRPDLGIDAGLAGGVLALLAVRDEVRDGEIAAAAASVAADLAADLARHAPDAPGPGALRGTAGIGWALRRAGRAAPDPAPVGPDPGWCEGAAGTVLTRLDTHPDLDPAAVAAVTSGPPLRDHALCHGEAGVLDALLELGDRAPDRVLDDRAAQLLTALAEDGPRCATPESLVVPGLLTGLAGIGYTLLRLARPDEVPSVLRLRATPPASPPRTHPPNPSRT